MSDLLYDRLGGEAGLKSIVRDVISNHEKNPAINVRFQDSDMDDLHQKVVDFFGMGSGGPQKYSGKDMRAAHKAMNISGEEFLAVLDDTMKALDNNNIDKDTKNEVLGILYSLKDDIVRL